jgi:hypothetical protein
MACPPVPLRCECRKGGTSYGGPSRAFQPRRHSHQVDRRGGEDVLHMCFGMAAVATVSYATPPDGLLVRALNPGPPGVYGADGLEESGARSRRASSNILHIKPFKSVDTIRGHYK